MQRKPLSPRPLGADGPRVKAVALGCMSFGGMYGATSEDESLECLQAAVDRGIDHLDTALIYGAGSSERIIGRFLRETHAEVTVATKGGIVSKPVRRFDNASDTLREALEGSLERLGRDHVELYYIHRREAERPIEEVMETLLGFRDEGLIGGIGFSEIAPSSLRRAASVGPVAAVQSEYSLWTRLPELGMLQATRDAGAAFVAFSPLARGMAGAHDPDPARFPEHDIRRNNPRFQPDTFPANAARFERFRAWCRERETHPSAVALAWTLRWSHVIAIPGTRSAAHLGEWADADEISLSHEDLREIEAILPAGFAHGDRYSDSQWVGVERYC